MKKLILLLGTCMAICANAGTNYIAGSLQVATNLSVRAQISTRTVVATNVTFQSVTPANYVLPPVNGITLFNSNGLFYSIQNLAGVYTTNGFGNTDYIAADGVVSNTLSERLIATNAALLTAIGNVSGTAGALTNNDSRLTLTLSNMTFRASGGASTKALQVFDVSGLEQFNVNDEGVHLPSSIYATGSADKGFVAVDGNMGIFRTFDAASLTNIHGSNSIAINTISTNNIDPTFYNLVTNIGAGSGTAYIAADDAVSNVLSARIIATNAALVTAYGSADTTVSNGVVTAYGSADTTVSNGLVTLIGAATNGLANYASTNYVNSATNGFTTTAYVNSATNGFTTTTYVNNATNYLIITTNKIDATFYNLLTNTGASSGGYQTGNSTDAINVNLTVTGNLIASNQTNTTLSVSNAYFSYANIAAGFDGDGKLIGTNAYIAADTVVSNGVVVAYGSADTVVSNGLSARIIATNAALVTAYGSADTTVSNGVVTAYGSADTTVSNGLSARIIATNAALVTAYGSADTTVSNGVVAAYGSADTVVSNGLSARIIATNAALVTAYGSADTVVSNGLVTLIGAATNGFTTTAYVNSATNGFTTTTYVNNATNNLIITTNKIDATFYNLVTNIGSGSGTAGALTNNETRAVTLNSDLTVLGNLVAANQTNTTLSVSNAYFSYTSIAAGFDGDGKLIGTNAYIAADTTVSNGLVTLIAAAAQTNISLAAVTNAGNIGYSNAIDFHTNGTVIVSPRQRIFPPAPQLMTVGTIAPASNTGYFVYIGKVEKTTTFARVRFQVTSAGNAAATNEVGLFSTPNAPAGTAQTLTRLAASAVQNSTASTGIKSNITSMAVSIAQGTHLWAGMRSASLATQPTCVALTYDMLGGAVLTNALINSLTNAANATITGAGIPPFATTSIAPSLRVTLD